MSDYVTNLLSSEGVTEEDIDRAEKEGWLPLLVVDHLLLPAKSLFTEDEVTTSAGADPGVARRLWRAMGFPDVLPGEAAFTEADVEALSIALSEIASLYTDPAPVETLVHETRVVSSSLARVAEIATDRLARALISFRESGVAEFEIAEMIGKFLDLERFDRLISYMYRRQFRAAMWRKLATHQDIDSYELAVGFVDIVRFTILARQLGAPELADMITRFEAATHDTVAALGGRVVKMIGDEIMFVTDDPATGVRIGLDVTDAHQNDDLLPDVRVGLAWGQVLSRDGDYFGPVVNLASRIVSAARPGKFVVSEETYKALKGYTEFGWRRLPLRPLKDIGVVRLWSPRRKQVEEEPESEEELPELAAT